MTDNFPQSPFTPGMFPNATAAATVTTAKKGRRGGERRPGRRSAAGMRWLFLLFAGMFGLLAVLVTATDGAKTYVIRAAVAVNANSDLTAEQFTAVALPAEAVEPDAYTGTSAEQATDAFNAAIAGKWFLYPVGAGQQIRTTMLVDAGTLAEPLAADERLMSITARAANAVAGGIKPGDVVDVYVSDDTGLTGVLGQGVEIVAVSLLPEQFDSVAQQQFEDPGKSLADFVPKNPVGGTYVLRIKAVDVGRYVAADAAGKITLALRSDGSTSFGAVPVDLYGAICGNLVDDPACARSAR